MKKKPAKKVAVAAVRMAKPKKNGRPPVMTAEVVAQVADWIGCGMTEEEACAHCRVNLGTFRKAVQRQPKFKAVVGVARTDRLAVALESIWQGQPGWQARAWLLERTFGERFRNKTNVKMEAKVENGGISADDWERIRKAAREWVASGNAECGMRNAEQKGKA